MREVFNYPSITRSLRRVLAYLRHAALSHGCVVREIRWFSLGKPRCTTGSFPGSLRERLQDHV